MTIEELRAYKDKKRLLGILTEQVNQDSLKGFDFSKVSVQGGKEGDPTSETLMPYIQELIHRMQIYKIVTSSIGLFFTV